MTHQARPFALGRFRCAGGPPFASVVLDEQVVALHALDPERWGDDTSIQDLLEDWDAELAALKEAVRRLPSVPGGAAVETLETLAPVPHPRQIFCAGANYGRHVVEMVMTLGASPDTDGMDEAGRRAYAEALVERQRREAEPYIFMKPVTTVAGPDDTLILPPFSDRIDWELELGVVIGRPTLHSTGEDALAGVAGYMIVNDLTARDRVRRTDPGAFGPDWVAAKGAPGFLPTGPYLVPAEFVVDPQNLAMQLSVNGETMQDDTTGDMTFDIARQIEFVSRFARMLPGDIICSGSPAGNGLARGRFLQDGDVMEARIAGLGKQTVRCSRPAG